MIEGFLERITTHHFNGWCFDRDDPSRHLTIQITLDGQVLATSVAATHRPDLESAGVGHGDHAFATEFTTPLNPTDVDRVRAYAINAEGRLIELRRFSGSRPNAATAGHAGLAAEGLNTDTRDEPLSSPDQAVQHSAPTLPVAQEAGQDFTSQIQGFIERILVSRVSGWVYDPTHPLDPVTVSVWVANEERARASAHIFRPDLLSAHIGRGNHGYRVELSQPLSGEEMASVRVVAETGDGRRTFLPRTKELMALGSIGTTQDRKHRPAFILGSPRTGSSAMAAALRQATRYRGFDEGHLFNLAGLLLTNLQEYYLGAQTALHNDTAIARVPADMIANRIKQAFIDLAHELFETPFWLDKTPTIEMVSYAPFFLSIWPNARFILTKRRGIENVMSRQRKFPDVAFEGHCLDWAGSMRAWLVVRAALEGKAIEVDQFSMSHDPSQVASDVSALLGLHATEAAALAAALRETRVEQTSADARKSVSLASAPWSEAEKHMFRQICGPMMEAYGYSDDESYFR